MHSVPRSSLRTWAKTEVQRHRRATQQVARLNHTWDEERSQQIAALLHAHELEQRQIEAAARALVSFLHDATGDVLDGALALDAVRTVITTYERRDA